MTYQIAGHWLSNPTIQVQTTLGEITIELNPEVAPLTAANWLAYVEAGHFNGLIFHRVIEGFMIQGGGLDANLVAKPVAEPIALESNAGLGNLRGTVAMARTSDPNSATSQFFINVADNGFLDYAGDSQLGYAVFGQVTTGMEVVDAIAASATGQRNGYTDVPQDTVLISQATVIDPGQVRTSTGQVQVAGADTRAWEYSLDSGLSWLAGDATGLTLAPGTYKAGEVQLRDPQHLATVAPLPAITVEPKAPHVSIASDDDLLLWGDNTAQLTFTLDQPSNDFSAEDVRVLGGQISDFSGSGRHYSATLTADPNYGRDVVVRVLRGQFSNADGITNLESPANLDALTLRADSVITTPTAADIMAADIPQSTAKAPTSAPLLIPNGTWLTLPVVQLSAQGRAVTVELMPDQAPLATAAWLGYLNAGAYNNTYVDYLKPSLIKAGSFNQTGTYQIPLYSPIPLESDSSPPNFGGTLAMYRGDSLAATSGFFINLQDNFGLDYAGTQSPGYTVFGVVTSDASALAPLAQTEVDTSGLPTTALQISVLNQTPGTVRSLTGELLLGGLSATSQWSYSLDSGTTWQTGLGATLRLPPGIYQTEQVQVKALNDIGTPSDAVLSTLPYQVLAGVQARSWAASAPPIEAHVAIQGDGYAVNAPVEAAEAQAIGLNDVLSALKLYLKKPVGTPQTQALQTIAADINADGILNLSDVLNLLKIYLKKPTDPGVEVQWTFVDASHIGGESSDLVAASNGSYVDASHTHAAPIDWSNTALAPIDLIGVLRGDVDGSWGA
jgi:peptidyl-prolyl cis-trans isomerase B (cyclophilin B)